MTTVSVAICAHISRREMAEALADQLACPISMDDGSLGSIANHDATLRLAAQTSTDWVILLEDDTEPIPEFYEQAGSALAASPAPLASLYFGYVGDPGDPMGMAIRKHDPHWVMCTGLANSVCLAVRADYVHPILEHAQHITDLPADHRYSAAARELGYEWIPHAYPSLVEHSDPVSLISPPLGLRRRAYRVGTRPDWSNDKSIPHP